jgi:hypothetical protein
MAPKRERWLFGSGSIARRTRVVSRKIVGESPRNALEIASAALAAEVI